MFNNRITIVPVLTALPHGLNVCANLLLIPKCMLFFYYCLFDDGSRKFEPAIVNLVMFI